MIRLFFALDLPEELRLRIGAISGGIDRARWVPEENLHLTLRFVGEVDEPTMEDIALAVDSIRFDPVEITLAGAGHFERRGKVTSIWLGVESTPALFALRNRVESALVRAGLPPEGRKYKPHVTVARMSGAAPDEVRSWLAANTMFRAVPFTARRFVLYSSVITRSGSAYFAECAFPRDS